MAVHLEKSLEKIPGWLEMKKHADEKLIEAGLQEWVVKVRAAKESEEGELVDEERSLHAECDPTTRTMDVVIGIGFILTLDEYKRLFPEVDEGLLLSLWMGQGNLGDPEEFAEANIVDTLQLLIYGE